MAPDNGGRSGSQEVFKHTSIRLNAVSVSTGHRWFVFGTQRGASVWDAAMHEKVVEVEGRRVVAIDISPDSSKFAAWTGEVSVWRITVTGERLAGPLEHHDDVRGVKFSPNGELIATTCEHDDTRVFCQLRRRPESFYPSRTMGSVFFVSSDNNFKVKSSDVSTRSQLVEFLVLDGGTVEPIALLAGDE